MQLTVGIALGSLIASVVDPDLTGGAGLRMLPGVVAFVLLVGLGAAAGPARRGLSIEPTEAMREH